MMVGERVDWSRANPFPAMGQDVVNGNVLRDYVRSCFFPISHFRRAGWRWAQVLAQRDVRSSHRM